MSWRTRGCIALAAIGAAVAAPAAAQTVVNEDFKLTAADTKQGDHFGYSLAVNGDVAIIGTFADWGSAYVFRFDGLSWTEEGKLIPSDGNLGDKFGVSVAISGDTAIIGADFDSDHGYRVGSAYIFRYNGTSWRQEAKLTASDGAPEDLFGRSVAIDDDTAVIGAYYHGSRAGAAYVFRYNGTSWIQEAKLTASDAQVYDYFGYSVAISGDTALVGAYGDDLATGAAYTFEFNGISWIQRAKLTASDAATYDYFGHSVAINGDGAIVGAYGDNARTGAAYIFDRDATMWAEQAKLTASDGAANDLFGQSVALCGDVAVVGAWNDVAAGSAYLYCFDGTSWSEQAKLLPSDREAGDAAGLSVGVGATVVIGAHSDDDNGSGSGSAYVFNLSTDSDGDGLSDTDEANRYGTDPRNRDTDGDWLWDGTEVNDTGTHPLWPDTDADGCADGYEVLTARTDPLSPDTDGDGVWDCADDMPLVPGVSSGQLEDMTRTLGDLIQLTDISSFNGANANADEGRRNALANRATSAANAIAAGDTLAAVEALESLIAKVDGVEPEPDWMHDSPEKEQLEADATLLLALLMM